VKWIVIGNTSEDKKRKRFDMANQNLKQKKKQQSIISRFQFGQRVQRRRDEK